ncbi:sugar phosphate isomerase/epimerase [soil metagenome]
MLQCPELSRFSLNQRTAANWPLPEALAGLAQIGAGGIGIWRESIAELGLAQVSSMIADSGLSVSSLCRAGYVTDPTTLAASQSANRRAVEEAAAIGARGLVFVAGGLAAGDRDLVGARSRIADAIAELVPFARAASVPLALEPMHPIFAADRGIVSTLGEALDLAEQFDSEDVGVVVDTFHVWWDPQILAQIARAGERILSYQVSDWITPLPPDTLLSRGVMGDGHIDFSSLTSAVTAAGYRGCIEVEIFNADLWSQRGEDILRLVAERYAALVAPWARD